MKNKTSIPPNIPLSKWLRLVCSVTLAVVLAVILLLLPITAGSIHLSGVSSTGDTFELALPFGAKWVRATGGLTLTKIAPATVNQGELLTYTIQAANNTGQNLTSATITDSAPLNTTCNSAEDTSSPSWAGACGTGGGGWILLYSPPIFPTAFTNGTTSVLTYSVNVAQPLPDQSLLVNNSYGISASGTSSFTDFGLPVTTVVNAPNWQISKSPSANIVQPGDFLTYTLTVTNNGHLATSGFYTISDTIPASATYVTNSASPAAAFDGANLTWTLNSPVAIDGVFTLSFVVQLDEPLDDNSQIVNQTYSITGGNVFSPAVGTPVTITVDSPVTLTLTKTDDPDPVEAGDFITYTLTVTNDASSKGPATNVEITDIIPANTTLVEAGFIGPAAGLTSTSGSLITWTLNTPNPLPINQAASVFMRVQVFTPLSNNSVITNDTYNVIASNGTVTVQGQPLVTTTVRSTPTLEIFKVGLPQQVLAGGLLTYTIHYTNSGNADATSVIISDTFPLSATFNSENSSPTITPGSAIAGGRQWTRPLLAGAGDTGVITLTLNVLSPQAPGTVLTNVISITSTEVAAATFFTATNVISSTPRLHIRKFADPNPVAVGSILTYTIVYSNDGNADATGVTITDTLDSRVTFEDASNGGTFSNGEVTWTGLAVPADGLDRSLSLSVTVASTLSNNSILTNNVAMGLADVVVTSSITTLVQAPTLTVTKTVSPTGVARAGDAIEYTITYTNTGAITITNPGILITDTFPVSVTNIVSSSTKATFVGGVLPELVWSDIEVPPNGSGIITLSGQVITSPWASSGGQIDNAVIVAGSGYSATATVNTEGRPGLPFTITLAAVPPTTQVGTNVLVGAQAEDAFGNPVFDGTPVTFTTSLSGSTLDGTATPVVAPTAGGGATVNLSSTAAGATTVAGQIAGVSNPLTDTTVVTFTPGAANRFIVTATSPQTAGVTFPITITAVDAFGNLVNSFNDAVTISDTTATITPTATTLVNGVRIRTYQVFSATTPLSTTITVITGTISGTVQVEIIPNVPDEVLVTVDRATIPICGTANLTTTVVDSFGNRIFNEPIDVLTATPGPVPNGTGSVNPGFGDTGPTGFLTATLTGTGAGNVRLSASSGALSNSPKPTVTVTAPAIPVSMTLTVAPNPLATGGNPATVTATVFDCFGPSASQVVTFTLSNPALVSMNPTTDTTTASGVATTTLTSNAIDGILTLTATTGSLVQTTTLVINSPALTITKIADPAAGSQVRPGQILNYTLLITNPGTGPVNNVVITDVLPTGVSFTACTSTTGSICSGGSATSVTTPTLGAGRVFTANIQVTVGAVTSGTVLSNQANARSAQTSLITSNLVAHSVTTATSAIFLPIVMKNFVAQPDLVSSFSLSPANPVAGQSVVVTVVITNIGTGPTDKGFWVDFYINPNPVPTVGNQRWDKLGSTLTPKRGIAWVIPAPGLARGASLTLTSNGVGGLAPSALHTSWPGSFATGTQDLYIYADSFSANGSPNGGLVELNESNNRSEFHFLSPLAGDNPINQSSLPDPDSLPPRWNP